MSETPNEIEEGWWATPLLQYLAPLQQRENQVFLLLTLAIGALTSLAVVAFMVSILRAQLHGSVNPSMRMPVRRHNVVAFPRFLFVSMLCFSCSGCLVVPIHHKTHVRSASSEFPPKEVDLSFIREGSTTRNEVCERLAGINSGIATDNFFIGRWSQNSWNVFWGAAAYPYAQAGSNEVWKAHNVIIDFDENTIVSGFAFFRDRDFITIVSRRLPALPNIDLTEPVKLTVRYFHNGDGEHPGTLILSSTQLEFLEDQSGKNKSKYSFTTPAQNVAELTMDFFSDPSLPEQMSEVLHFKRKTRIGKKMKIRIGLAETATLIEYIASVSQTKGPAQPAQGMPKNRIN